MVELRLSNIVSIGLAAVIFIMVVKFALRHTPYSNFAELM